MKQAVGKAIDSVKIFLSDRKNWIKIVALAVLVWAVIEAIVKQRRDKKEKEASNENDS